jgi:hypothetical protein
MTATTVVTMFFNLKDFPDASASTRPIEFYKEHGRPTLSIQAPMVIFCDSKTRPWIEEIRAEVAPGIFTRYMEKSLVDYDFFRLHYPIIYENRSVDPDKDNRNTISYFLTTMFKLYAIQFTKLYTIHPNTTHYAWIDFGASHIAKDAFLESCHAMISAPRPKVAVCYIHYRSASELKSIVDYSKTTLTGIAATVFTVEATYVSKLFVGANEIFYKQLTNGVGHTEETVLTFLYDRHPELFTLYYGDYSSCIQNYHEPVQNQYEIYWFFVKNAKDAGRYDLAKQAAGAVLATGKTSDFLISDYTDMLHLGD